MVEGLNEALDLPETVIIRLRPRGDAFFNPEENEIVIGYDLLRLIDKAFAVGDPRLSLGDRDERIVNVATFVLIHEVGHALVENLNLPITAREEDSVDNLATVIAITYLDRGDEVALDFADFSLYGPRGPARAISGGFWDEHSFNDQRANDTTCLVYGAAPKRNRHLRRVIPSFRRQRCAEEWQLISSSWLELLEPHLREEIEIE